MQVDLIRLETGIDGTFGVLRIKGQAFCVTLEPPDRNNARQISCIPAGLYLCKRHMSPRWGETFKVSQVSSRDNILFHAGNVAGHSQGCILLGQYFGKLREDRAVLNSGMTFKNFMREMDGLNQFTLDIKSV